MKWIFSLVKLTKEVSEILKTSRKLNYIMINLKGGFWNYPLLIRKSVLWWCMKLTSDHDGLSNQECTSESSVLYCHVSIFNWPAKFKLFSSLEFLSFRLTFTFFFSFFFKWILLVPRWHYYLNTFNLKNGWVLSKGIVSNIKVTVLKCSFLVKLSK